MKHELLLDIDRKLSEKTLIRKMNLLKQIFKFKFNHYTKKKTAHGVHVRLFFNSDLKLKDNDIVFFQLFLGSDYKRELFNLRRVIAGLKNWNVLFNAKYNSKGKMISCEE